MSLTGIAAVKQNFHVDTEAGINKQINMELTASYVYQAIAFYFDRADVALEGLHKYFKEQSDEEREHAEKLMKYQNLRGGALKLSDIKKPPKENWGSPLEALESALQLERDVNQSLLDLHSIASNHGDAQFCDFIESEYLQEQVEAIKTITGMITNLKRVGPGLGEYLFSKSLHESK